MTKNLSELMRTPATELFAIYAELEAPSLAEMQGEYAATLLPQIHPLIEFLGRASIYNPLYPGHWLAKGFNAAGSDRGEGYNLFRFRNRMVTRWPMQTLIHPSGFDSKPAFQLVYPSYRSICGSINMIDELRRIDTGLYLGFGTCGFTQGQRGIRLPFALQGAISEFRGMPDNLQPKTDALTVLN